MPFTESVRSRHVPLTPLTRAWPPSLPSVPTSRATRVTSSAKLESWSTIVFTVVPMRANSPLTGWASMGMAIFSDRSPSARASMTRATSGVGRGLDDARDLGRRAHEVVDQRVDRLDVLGPAAGHRAQRGAFHHAALAA